MGLFAWNDDFPILVRKDYSQVGFHHPAKELLILEFKGPERHIAILLGVGLHKSNLFLKEPVVE